MKDQKEAKDLKEIQNNHKETVKDFTSYKGEVEIGIVRKGIKHKKYSTNKGTINLFKYLCGCLYGSVNPNYDISIRPGKLRVLDPDGNYVLSYGIPFEEINF